MENIEMEIRVSYPPQIHGDIQELFNRTRKIRGRRRQVAKMAAKLGGARGVIGFATVKDNDRVLLVAEFSPRFLAVLNAYREADFVTGRVW